ncbi:CPCC family cysteine-rich protein [Asticcacaulis machinosus]|uniref:CPCC family cysteine-rich protein n=1 Tax=Asticcacaulis machinosus TaxID=2984211 RepID=A0ABT5HHF5_9CAUL|nr:CPCC family cysteine-rich protein [Asticcacaulis machinosus]MDC7675677.1 CPCC family cysteine-rich protein [Asticcacaulis machinosus]
MTYPRTVLCPCCKFPTLKATEIWGICVICWWEDDGQNDYDAHDVRGGPNSRYSLTAARANFADHGHMYDRGKGIKIVEQPSAARSNLIDYLRSIQFSPLHADAAHLTRLLTAADAHINQNRTQF